MQIMAMPESLERLPKLLNEWELRFLVLVSLFLQIILTVFSSRRKHTVTPWIGILIWSAYSSADWVATVFLGTLSNSPGDSQAKRSYPNHNLIGFWSPFLLLHLGGPDTISAYSLEDNELWSRHLHRLIAQVGVALYVFQRSWISTRLTFLSIPMFVAGITKYGERTWVLRSASRCHLRDSLFPVPDSSPAYTVKGSNHDQEDHPLPSKILNIITSSTTPRVDDLGGKLLGVEKAYFLFKNQFKHLCAGLTPNLDGQNMITYKSCEEAFSVVEMELNFMYDALYTKATMIYSLLGILLRSACFIFTIFTSVGFCFFIDKSQFAAIDIGITYILLFGTVFLEIYGLMKLILSDRSIVWLSSKRTFLADSICGIITSFRSVLTTSEKRWSGRVARHNLIDSCLRDKPSNFNLGMNKLLDRYWYLKWEKVDGVLREPIFSWLLKMKNCGSDIKHRGDYVITEKGFMENLGWSVVDVAFDHSILIWHIATDIFHSGGDGDVDVEKSSSEAADVKSRHRIISKCLSEYMLYLLVMCPFMLPKGVGVGGGEFRYRETCREAKRIILQQQQRRRGLHYSYSMSSRNDICKALLLEADQVAESKISTEKTGRKCLSVLMEACEVVKRLEGVDKEKGSEKWVMVSQVWVEMLCYAAAATHCGWIQHLHQLRRGGELLTHVSLLFSHLRSTNDQNINHQ